MTLDLEIKGTQEITQSDRKDIDEFIEYAIDLHKGNSSQINKLVIDSVTALTISEARSSELADQKFFKRRWNGITGKNQKIRADIDINFAKSQYASQQMIQKLAEQNLLAFDTITAVNNKLNTLMLDVDEEINKVYKTLVVFFKQTRSDLIQMESRINKLERNVDLLNWNSTIEYRIYDGEEYCELPNVEKIVCVVNDFYHKSKTNWSTPDLMLLKSTLSGIGLPVKSKLSSNEFYEYLTEKPKLIGRLFKDIEIADLEKIEEFQAPLLKGVEKILKLQGEEKYIVDTVVSRLELSNVEYNKRDIQISIIYHYLLDTAFMQTDAKVNMFDFVVELLSNLKMMNMSGFTNEIDEELPNDLIANNNEDELTEIKQVDNNIILKNSCGFIEIIDGNIFYLVDRELYIENDNGKFKKDLPKQIDYIWSYDNYVYATTSDEYEDIASIYKINGKDYKYEEINTIKRDEILNFDGEFLYIKVGYETYKQGMLNFNITKESELEDASNIVRINDFLYFIESRNLVRMNIVNKKKIIISLDKSISEVYQFYIGSDYILMLCDYNSLVKSKLDGSNMNVVVKYESMEFYKKYNIKRKILYLDVCEEYIYILIRKSKRITAWKNFDDITNKWILKRRKINEVNDSFKEIKSFDYCPKLKIEASVMYVINDSYSKIELEKIILSDIMD